MGPNIFCLVGGVIGIISMLGFTWVHAVAPDVPILVPRGSPELVDMVNAAFADRVLDFGSLFGAPGMLLFLIGTGISFATSAAGFVQGAGLAVFLSTFPQESYAPAYWDVHLELGFFLATVSTLMVLIGLGFKTVRGVPRVYHSRLAALSPRLSLFAT